MWNTVMAKDWKIRWTSRKLSIGWNKMKKQTISSNKKTKSWRVTSKRWRSKWLNLRWMCWRIISRILMLIDWTRNSKKCRLPSGIPKRKPIRFNKLTSILNRKINRWNRSSAPKRQQSKIFGRCWLAIIQNLIKWKTSWWITRKSWKIWS